MIAHRPPVRRRDRWILAWLSLSALLAVLPAPAAAARNAYVTNRGGESFTVLDTATNFISSPIGVGPLPTGVAIAPDAGVALVANFNSGSVSVIDAHANQVLGGPIGVGTHPATVAIAPGGRTAYVANVSSGTLSAIDIQSRTVIGSPVIGGEPDGVAITPDGRFAYVSSFSTAKVSVVDTQTNQVVGSPIVTEAQPNAMAITPDGRYLYVAMSFPGKVTVIDTQTNQPVGTPITVGERPEAIAITPDGSRAYVVNRLSKTVSVIDTQTRQVIGSPIGVGLYPIGIAISPDGKHAYVVNSESSSVSVIDTQANQVIGSAITGFTGPWGIAIVPDQPPHAALSAPALARPGVPVAFDAAASTDADGSIARYAWSFGDGQVADAGSAPTHTYGAPGSYEVGVTLTDNEGCSTALLYTGQTASCNGLAQASQARTVNVAFPGVRVKCPKRAKRRRCQFRLQVISKKKKGKPETAVAKVGKLKAGKSAVVSLKPKKAFAAKLATAKKVLVKQTLAIGGETKTSFRRLKIVQ